MSFLCNIKVKKNNVEILNFILNIKVLHDIYLVCNSQFYKETRSSD